MRVPRIQGFPKQTLGSMEIRESSSSRCITTIPPDGRVARARGRRSRAITLIGLTRRRHFRGFRLSDPAIYELPHASRSIAGDCSQLARRGESLVERLADGDRDLIPRGASIRSVNDAPGGSGDSHSADSGHRVRREGADRRVERNPARQPAGNPAVRSRSNKMYCGGHDVG